MKDINEIMNKYIDGELTESESAEFKKQLEASKELRAKLNAMLLLDKHLRKAEPDSPSAMFTANVMNRLKSRSSSAKSQNYFIAFVTGFFALVSIGILGYAISAASNSPSTTGSTLEISDYLNIIVSDLVSLVSNLFNPKYFSYIGSLLSAIILVSGYFFFEHHRKLIKKTSS